MKKIAIFASGNGTNAENLIKSAKQLENIEISFILTDNLDAGVISRAKKLNIKSIVIPKTQLTKHEHEALILQELKKHGIDWVFLAGYMRILSRNFLNQFYNEDLDRFQVINIHPSLLPEFKGLHALKRAFDNEVKTAGISIHYVNAQIDEGDIILQEEFSRDQNDSFEQFCAKAHALEYQLYPQVLKCLNNFPSLISLESK